MKKHVKLTQFSQSYILPATNVILWFNNTQLIASNKVVTAGGSRIIVDREHHALTILNVDAHDTSKYSCNLLPNNSTEYFHLKVQTPPQAEIFSNDRDITGRSMTFRQGEHIDIVCKGRGFPEPSYIWSAGGHRIVSDAHYKVEGGRLQITNPNHEHVHTYQCLADNGIGVDHVSVTINIQCKLFLFDIYRRRL